MVKVSVIMSVYKEPVRIVKRSVESVLNQTFTDWEFIIVLDWPENIELRNYLVGLAASNSKITFLENDRNRGQGYSRNRAIDIAKADLIMLQDGDDFSLPNRMEVQYNYLVHHPEIDVLGTAITYCDLESNVTYYTKYYSNDIYKVLKRQNVCGHPTLMLRKKVFTEVAKYETELIKVKGIQVYSEDYELYIKWYLGGVTIFNLTESYYMYQRDNNIAVKAKGMIRSVITIKNKYAHELKFGLSDYLYMYLQKVLILLPTRVIVFLHSVVNR